MSTGARRTLRTNWGAEPCVRTTTSGSPPLRRGAAPTVRGVIAAAASALTFDMRGGRKQAKLACGRPLDGRVRRHFRSASPMAE